MHFEKFQILVIEDDVSFASALGELLEMDCYQVRLATCGAEAVAVLSDYRPHLIISDLTLPDSSGHQLLKHIQKEIDSIPYLFLSGKTQDAEIVLGLEQGAEDYITKPFRTGELLARIRKILQRHYQIDKDTQSHSLSQHGISLSQDTHQVSFQGQFLDLTAREFDLLSYLMIHAGQIRTRVQILECLWANDYNISDRIIDSHISHLRTKLSKAGCKADLIQTIRGLGYKFRK